MTPPLTTHRDPPPTTLEQVHRVLVRGHDMAILTSSCMLKRRAEWVALLRRLPPTTGMLHVARSNGEVVFDAPAPTEAEWNAYLDRMAQSGALWDKDPGLEALFDFELALDEKREAVEMKLKIHDAAQKKVDTLVNNFVARQEGVDQPRDEEEDEGSENDAYDDDEDVELKIVMDEENINSLETIAVVHYLRAVVDAAALQTPPPDCADFFRRVLFSQEGVRRSLDTLQHSVFEKARVYAEFLDRHDWILRMGLPDKRLEPQFGPLHTWPWPNEQRCDNVAKNPWSMSYARISATHNTLVERFGQLADELHFEANNLRDAAEAAASAEYTMLMTDLSNKMSLLDERVLELVSKQENDDRAVTFTSDDGKQLDVLAKERAALQVRVVEPLLRQYAYQLEQSKSGAEEEDEYYGADGISNTVWSAFYEFGEPDNVARLSEYVQKHADENVLLKKSKEEVRSTVRRIEWHYYVLGTMVAVHRHLLIAWAVHNHLPPDARRPNGVDPNTLLRVLGETNLLNAQHWRFTPRARDAIADCVDFLFEWYALGPRTERYKAEFLSGPIAQALARDTEDPNIPNVNEVRRVSVQLPSLHDAAAALVGRAQRAQTLVALARFASQGLEVASRA